MLVLSSSKNWMFLIKRIIIIGLFIIYLITDCLLSEVDVFMTGSDQIWNCCHRFDSFMFLDFVGGGKRVAYASSIGTNCVPENMKTG